MSSEASDVVLSIQNISKCFEMYDKPAHRLLQMLRGNKRKYYKEFWALKDISFEVHRGECVGIIGRNGAGKSTLLQIITGTLQPTCGSVEVKGRIAALLELGSGFNPEFSGRENVYMNGAVLGLSTEEIDKRYGEIVSFAEIGDFIDQPVKTYSSGMMVRLAFAVQIMLDPDILIIDEALAVGDAFFQQKCMRYIKGFIKDHTVIFVSHDTGAITALCTRAVLLSKGRIECIGDADTVSKKYLLEYYQNIQEVSGTGENQDKGNPAGGLADDDFRDMRADLFNQSTLRNDIEVFKFNPDAESFGSGGVKMSSMKLLDAQGRPLAWAVGGERLILRICFESDMLITSPIVGFTVKNKYGQSIVVDNTYLTYRDKPFPVFPGESFYAEFEFLMPIIAPGEYSISPAIADGTQENHVQLLWLNDAMLFTVHSSSCMGMIGLPMKRIELRKA